MVAVRRSEEMNFGRAKGGGSALLPSLPPSPSPSLSIQTGPTVLLPSLLLPPLLLLTWKRRRREENWSVWKGLLAGQAGEGDDLGRLGRLRLVGAGGSSRLPTKDEG